MTACGTSAEAVSSIRVESFRNRLYMLMAFRYIQVYK